MSNERVTGRPLLVVLTAPSGAGKTTLRDRLLQVHPEWVYSVSCTTRPPRPGERDGLDYHFLSEEEFDCRVRAEEFLEQAVVHGYRYGTLKAPIEAALRGGRSVLMDLDVQGAAAIRNRVRQACPDDLLRAALVDIFIIPPSLAALRERLERRGQDSPESIARRLQTAEEEMRRSGEFRYVVVNDVLEEACRQLVTLLEQEARRYE